MNTKDRERMRRLSEMISEVPFPCDGAGAQTATMHGYIGYANDMHMFEPLLKYITLAIYLESLNATLDPCECDLLAHYDIEEMLTRGEEWIAKRKREGWLDTDKCQLLHGITMHHNF